MLQAADGLRVAERFNEATDLLRALHAQRPGLGEVLKRLGEVARDAADLSQARDLLTRAAAADTSDVWSHLALASLMRRMGLENEEIQVVDTAIRRFPESTRALEARAALHADANDFDSALSTLLKARALAPADAHAWAAVVRLHDRFGRAQDMLVEAQQLVQAYPQMAQGQVLLAQAFVGCSRVPEARAAYARLIAMHPWHKDARLALARISAPGEARELAAQVLALDPTSLPAMRLRARFLPDSDPVDTLVRCCALR